MPDTCCAVVIMLHAAHPSPTEEASFIQCLRILGRHDIALVCPESLNLERYNDLCARCGCVPTVQRFKDVWFQSVETYNTFMLQPELYHRFAAYEYLLVYQLDAWVFKDELDAWCDKNFVYVGAPFFNDRGELFPFAGNGGFSLRRVRDFITVLEGRYATPRWNYAFLLIELPARTPLRAAAKRMLHMAEMLVCRVSTKWYCAGHHEHEDFIFSKAFSFLGKGNVPLPGEAAFFAFERCPERLFEETGRQLPFGCHAFEKYNPTFWNTWISL